MKRLIYTLLLLLLVTTVYAQPTVEATIEQIEAYPEDYVNQYVDIRESVTLEFRNIDFVSEEYKVNVVIKDAYGNSHFELFDIFKTLCLMTTGRKYRAMLDKGYSFVNGKPPVCKSVTIEVLKIDGYYLAKLYSVVLTDDTLYYVGIY